MKKIVCMLAVVSIVSGLAGCSTQDAKQQVDHAKDVLQWAFSDSSAPSAPTDDPQNAKQAGDVAAKFARKYFDFASWQPNQIPAEDLIDEAWKPKYIEAIPKHRQGIAEEFGKTLPSLKDLKVTKVEYQTANLGGKDTLVYRITFDLIYNPNPKPIENHTGTVYVGKFGDQWKVFGVQGKVGK